jgi:hypothetical protein
MIKYEYQTTIVYLNDCKVNAIKVNPPDDNGWSLLSMTPSHNGTCLYYTWAKQQPMVQFTSSDEDFQKSLDLVKVESAPEAQSSTQEQ